MGEVTVWSIVESGLAAGLSASLVLSLGGYFLCQVRASLRATS